MEKRDELLYSIRYFWQEKGDLERFSGIEEAFKAFPVVKDAWDRYKMAEQSLTLIIKGLD